jgi:hypothetical protein
LFPAQAGADVEAGLLDYPIPMKQHDAFVELLKKRSPTMDAAQMQTLAAVWSETSDRIIRRTLDLGQVEVGSGLHIETRPQAIYELARLMLFLNGKILDHKERDRALADYDPDEEKTFLASEAGKAIIEGTARNLADGAWKPLLERWRAYRPLIEPPPPKHPPRRIKKTSEPHRRRMHFVPQFSTKPWADEKTGKFDVHTLGLDGEVRTKHGTAKVWGAIDYLYTQQLETRLGEIERDGREPFRKLARTIPLTDLERRYWIAFLVSQLVRTPREMTRIMAGTKALIANGGVAYPTDPAHLARAFETLFTANELYAQFHKLIMGRAWRILCAAPDASFLKADNPVAISGSTKTGNWSLVFSLTPKKLFVVGPDLSPSEPPLIPERIELDAKRTTGFNKLICGTADHSVISTHGAVDPRLRQIVKTGLGGKRRPATQALPYWGFNPTAD